MTYLFLLFGIVAVADHWNGSYALFKFLPFAVGESEVECAEVFFKV